MIHSVISISYFENGIDKVHAAQCTLHMLFYHDKPIRNMKCTAQLIGCKVQSLEFEIAWIELFWFWTKKKLELFVGLKRNPMHSNETKTFQFISLDAVSGVWVKIKCLLCMYKFSTSFHYFYQNSWIEFRQSDFIANRWTYLIFLCGIHFVNQQIYFFCIPEITLIKRICWKFFCPKLVVPEACFFSLWKQCFHFTEF